MNTNQQPTPLPPLEQVLEVTNALLSRNGLPTCHSVKPGPELGSQHPIVYGRSETSRYVIKVFQSYSDTIEEEAIAANFLQEQSGLPIPYHFCFSDPEDNPPVLVMEWMPGEQIWTALPKLPMHCWTELAEDWGACLGRLHTIQLYEDELPFVERPADPDEAIRDQRRQIHWSACTALSDVEAHTAWLAARKGLIPNDQLMQAHEWIQQHRELVESNLNSSFEAALHEPAPMIIAKRHHDIREYLCITEHPPYISAMLNWENVYLGDPAQELGSLFVRFQLMNTEVVWPAFIQGYGSEHGELYEWTQAALFYAFAESILSISSGGRPDTSMFLLEGLISGRISPLMPAATVS